MSGLSQRRRYLVLAICCLSLFIVGLDTTIVNVALPSIGRELHASVSGLQWTIDAYALVLASPLPSGFAAATRPGWWIIAACGAAVIVLALITTGRRGKASAAKTASLVATAEEAAEKVPAASG